MILSTSLHGLIVADSLGIPAVWSLPEPYVAGGDFKFRDHESVVCPVKSRRVNLKDLRSCQDVVDRAVCIDAERLSEIQNALALSVERLKGDLGLTGRTPFAAWSVAVRRLIRRHRAWVHRAWRRVCAVVISDAD